MRPWAEIRSKKECRRGRFSDAKTRAVDFEDLPRPRRRSYAFDCSAKGFRQRHRLWRGVQRRRRPEFSQCSRSVRLGSHNVSTGSLAAQERCRDEQLSNALYGVGKDYSALVTLGAANGRAPRRRLFQIVQSSCGGHGCRTSHSPSWELRRRRLRPRRSSTIIRTSHPLTSDVSTNSAMWSIAY